MNPFIGVLLHAVAGLAAASFYIPFKKVKGWAWETYWLTQGFAAWVVMPIVIAWLTTPGEPRVGSFRGCAGAREPYLAVLPYSTWLLDALSVFQTMEALVLPFDATRTPEIIGGVPPAGDVW